MMDTAQEAAPPIPPHGTGADPDEYRPPIPPHRKPGISGPPPPPPHGAKHHHHHKGRGRKRATVLGNPMFMDNDTGKFRNPLITAPPLISSGSLQFLATSGKQLSAMLPGG